MSILCGGPSRLLRDACLDAWQKGAVIVFNTVHLTRSWSVQVIQSRRWMLGGARG
ncbi:uncharacterized protein B0H18DRAFT_1007651 [Fomitopsis serialis]|uniref:uncharacterized protein n=1 Tax=Fomitopsis serialis TaxID=139415 RepID=UPI002008B0A6|nr:uncharacterized protein B0H18DRAFT_1007651 [Neoantrodia serialis]KAH9926037.1 hypothetical protein B0H18DRAFT_1007651 [Neoantrodia serialis]